MKIGTMLGDITISLMHKPVTERYPFEHYPTPERLRGRLFWDAEKCTGCGLCTMDCPSEAIEVFVLDRKAKRFVFKYKVDSCTFCAQCVASCRQGSIQLSSEVWELAALNEQAFTIWFGEDEDVRHVMEGLVPSEDR